MKTKENIYLLTRGWLRTSRGVAILGIVLLACALTVQAAPLDKVELCHVPPDNPDNAQEISVNAEDVDEHLVHGDILGQCPPTAAELDPPVVRVDDTLEPPATTIAGINGGPPRPLARMHSDTAGGITFDFVANEIYLISDDEADLAGFMSRWPAVLLNTIELPGTGTSAAVTRIYQVAVDASRAKTRRLDGDLAFLSPRLHGQYTVSGEAALRLLALVADETRRQGLKLGINPLLESQDFADMVSEEAMIGDDIHCGPYSERWWLPCGPLSFTYTSNAFDWPYMNRHPDVPGDDQWPLDTGVSEALRSVEAEGRMGNRVKTLIADGGFFPNDDFPPYVHIGELRVPNPDPSGCGRGFPAPGDSVCGTHGTHVAITGFGLPDNGFGTMGPGGPVSELITVQSPSSDVVGVIGYIVNALPDALSERPRIINVSASTNIPGGWCPLACPPLDLLGFWLQEQGIVFVAAAGNNAQDVDETDEVCALGCIEFEAAHVIPCEIATVTCVGAHTFFESRRANYSNFGTGGGPNSVDIFAPGNLYSVDAAQADPTTARRDDLQEISGTSFAAPFVAGVYALTLAANPSLTPAQLHSCILDTAHTSSLTGEARRINALGAVSCAMSGSWPWVEILQPANGATFERGLDNLTLRAKSDDYEQGDGLVIDWTSSIDGPLGSSASEVALTLPQSLGLSIGEHEICASVMDNSSRDWGDCVDVEVTSAAPTVEILSPFNGQDFIQSTDIDLLATVYDLDESPIADIEWVIEEYYSFSLSRVIATGTLDTSIPAADLPPGRYVIYLHVTDDTGARGSDSKVIDVVEDPSDLPPRITIESPANGASFESQDGGAVTIELVANASDPEDGPIDFERIQWSYLDTQGFFRRLDVERECLLHDFRDPSLCLIYGPWTFELSPRGSNTTTRHVIRGTVEDSAGNETQVQIVLYITQLI